MSLNKKILIFITCLIGGIVTYFGAVDLGTLIEHWLWHTCTTYSIDLHLIKPLYGSFVFALVGTLAVLWLLEKRHPDYSRLYNDINHEPA